MSNDDEYYTCSELMEKYPFLEQIGWSARKIGIFYRANLLIGRKSGRESKTLILESSFKELVDYAQSKIESSFKRKWSRKRKDNNNGGN